MPSDRKLVAEEGWNPRLSVEFPPEVLANLDGLEVYGPVSPEGELDMARAWYRVKLSYERRGSRADPKTGKLWAVSYAPLMTAAVLSPEEMTKVAAEREAAGNLFRTKSWLFVPVWEVDLDVSGPKPVVVHARVRGLNIAAEDKALYAAQATAEAAASSGRQLAPLDGLTTPFRRLDTL